jgi:ribosomal protein S6E (S10)
MMMRKAVDGVVPMVDESIGKEILKIFRNPIGNCHKCKQKGARKRKTTRQGEK